MTYRNRNILRITIFLTALLAAGSGMAQVHVHGNVYGGGNLADVGQSVTVNISGGEVNGDVYGGGAKAHTNTANWDESATPKFTQTYHAVTIKEGESVVGYYEDAAGATPATDNAPAGGGTYYKKTETIVNLTGGEVIQDVYGGGLGYDDEDNSKDQPANVYGDVTVTMTGGKARDVFGANNVLGTPKGVIAVNINGTANDGVRNVYGGGNQATYEGFSTTVTMTAGKAVNVYGGGLSADVAGSVTVNIQGGTVTTDVYGGGALGHTNTENESGSTIVSYHEVSLPTGTSLVGYYTETSGTYTLQSSGEAAADGTYYRKTETIVNLTDGSIGRDVYGGGLGRKAADAVEDDPETPDDESSDAVTAVEAKVYGNVTVNIGAAPVAPSTTPTGNVTIGGSVFGCNNLNGTPKGDVLVNIYKTAHTTGNTNNQYPSGITTLEGLNSLSNEDNNFAIKAVYGGGNQAHYIPVAPTGDNPDHSTTVYVYGCSENTIKTVYGGGNAADVGTTGDSGVSANTNVIIEGGRFDMIFGGGNGYSETNNHNDPTDANYNPGANIYGTATTEIQGGLFQQVFGGSNQYGNVRATSLSINELCDNLLIKESFGGANEAEITGDVTTTLACGENKIGTFYGGSNKANIYGNVTLNVEGGEYINVFGGSKGVSGGIAANIMDNPNTDGITEGNVTLNLFGGTMDNAFGGSDANGNITGKITVNILDKEAPTCSLTVHNIYGGGRDASYRPTTPGAYPEVNLIRGTVSKKEEIVGENTTYTGGNVFGGGLGSTATVNSSPKVNVGYNPSMSDLVTLLLPSGTSLTTANVTVEGNVYGGGEQAPVTYGTSVTVHEGTSASITTEVRGDVYGGGKLADVGGSVEVSIEGGTVKKDVYGGGALADTNTDNWVNNELVYQYQAVTLSADDPLTGYYVRSGSEGSYTYTLQTSGNYSSGTYYERKGTKVNLNGGKVEGDVYGGGLGQEAITGANAVPEVQAKVYGDVTVTINGTEMKTGYTTGDNPVLNAGRVFGANNVKGTPKGHVKVLVKKTAEITGQAIDVAAVFGGGNKAEYEPYNSTTEYAEVEINKDENQRVVVGNVYGGGNEAGIVGGTQVNIVNGDVLSGVYGGCNTSGTVSGTATVNLTGGTVGTSGTIGDLVFGGGYGSGTTITTAIVNIGEFTTTTGENLTITYSGTSNIYGNVYGGSALGTVGTATVNLNSATTLSGHVFGGGMGRLADNTANPVISAQPARINTSATVYQRNITMATGKNIYGGCNVNGTAAATTVTVTGGSVTDVFGGGFGAKTYVTGDVVVNIGETDQSDAGATILGDVYGGSAQGHVNLAEPGSGTWPAYNSAATTSVNLYKGIIYGDAYGGGLGLKENFNGSGSDVPAYVGGNVNVTLNGVAFKIDYYDNDINTDIDESQIVKSGRVFGSNNLCGMPLGDVTVTVHKTVGVTTTNGVTTINTTKPTKGTGYELAAVYGGGNLAPFTTSDKKTKVIINSCTDTSIEYVYGGGNAAPVPATDVEINGAYEIGYVFGGGNGKDPFKNGNSWVPNEGANVNGSATTLLKGGTIHEAYGGSNERGTIGGTVSINTGSGGDCQLNVTKIYGAGKNADVEGDLIVVLGCKEARTEEVYGGAENANVKGNVELTITSGTFGKVFGGSNMSGAIFGHIIVNIEESGCTPINIEELYLGGNDAFYSVYGYYHAKADDAGVFSEGNNIFLDEEKTIPLYKDENNYLYLDQDKRRDVYKPRTSSDDTDHPIVTFPAINNNTVPNTTTGQYDNPELNIISATSIGKVFGGGLGSGAYIYGSPTVNINQTYPLEYDEVNDVYKVRVEDLGPIGGGYKDKNNQDVEGGVFGGGNRATVYGNTTVNIGNKLTVDMTVLEMDATTDQPKLDATTGKFKTQTLTGKSVQGAKITGNVYGGGNNAAVNGNAEVNILVKKESNGTYSAVSYPANIKGFTITGDVFGGGNEGEVTGNAKVRILKGED